SNPIRLPGVLNRTPQWQIFGHVRGQVVGGNEVAVGEANVTLPSKRKTDRRNEGGGKREADHSRAVGCRNPPRFGNPIPNQERDQRYYAPVKSTSKHPEPSGRIG